MSHSDIHPHPEVHPFEVLLNRYRGMLFRLCHHLSGREATPEDLMQEMVLALWLKREELQAPRKEAVRKVWVWRVAHNAAVDYLRKSPGHQELDTTMIRELRAEDNALVSELHELIALIDEPDRTIVRMQLAGYSYDEIAHQVQMSQKNVSVRLVRIKEKLRKQMNGSRG